MTDILGGWSAAQSPDYIQDICNKVKSLVERTTNKVYELFRAHEYRSQIVAGTNYMIKVNVGGEKYIVVKVLQHLPCYGGMLEVTGVQEDKAKEDPIIPF